MANYKMDTYLGNDFNSVAMEAKVIAYKENNTVEFDFNGVLCLVNSNTDLNHLFRDFKTSWIMGWKQIGADCDVEYSPELKIQIEEKERLREERNNIQQEEYRKKEAKEKAAFAEKVSGLQMEFKNKDAWDRGLSVNTDPYGGCVYEYAEGWAKLMQREILNGKKVHECAEKTSFELSFLGITGFMYGAAVSVLSECWLYGEQLRKWHNKEYNHEGDGVVNPAILTISA